MYIIFFFKYSELCPVLPLPNESQRKYIVLKFVVNTRHTEYDPLIILARMSLLLEVRYKLP